MREIKFRAWDKHTKTMWPWEKMQTFEGDPHLKPYFEDSDNNVMQYTGLKDKNGKEIYEGDILYIDYEGYDEGKREQFWCTIVWHDGGFCFKELWEYEIGNPPTVSSKPEPVNEGGSANLTDYEVIGNIYENPELIKTLDK